MHISMSAEHTQLMLLACLQPVLRLYSIPLGTFDGEEEQAEQDSEVSLVSSDLIWPHLSSFH
jgi:hypothetical protein